MLANHVALPWSRVEGSLPPYGELNAQQVDNRLFVAVDHDGHRHALILETGKPTGFSDEKSRGLAVMERYLELEGHKGRLFIDARCGDRRSNEAFDAVIADIARRLSAGDDPEMATRTTLLRWRRFWGGGPTEGLSAEQVRGLFAELWFLARWLLPVDSAHSRHWSGPAGARHDFQWSSVSVEVKATKSARGHIHKINGLDQLCPPDDGSLFLFSLRLREEQGGKYTLPDIIDEIGELLQSDPEGLDFIHEGLARLGYSPLHASRYREIRFWVAEPGLFSVDQGFPRLTAASFVGGLPAGVERVEYEVNLSVCPELCVASTPDQIPRSFRR